MRNAKLKMPSLEREGGPLQRWMSSCGGVCTYICAKQKNLPTAKMSRKIIKKYKMKDEKCGNKNVIR